MNTTKVKAGAALAATIILASGCGSSNNGIQSDSSGFRTSQGEFPSRAAIAATVDGCRSNRTEAEARRIRNSFVSESDNAVRLILAGTAVRPGGRLRVAIVNDSGKSVSYGSGAPVTSEATRKQIRIPGMGYSLELLISKPHALGFCDVAFIPSSTPPGRYRVTKSVEIGSHPGPAIDDKTKLTAEFEVRGKPLPHPEWEAQLRNVRIANRQQRIRQAAKAQAGGEIKPGELTCPIENPAGFRVRKLEGKELQEATRIAKAHQCTIRVVKQDGRSLPVTSDLRPDRIDVVVSDGRVTRVPRVG